MEATTIAHLVGRMDVILNILEFYAGQIEAKDYRNGLLMRLLMDRIGEAKDVNENIFKMHKKNEFDKIKKIYDYEDK